MKAIPRETIGGVPMIRNSVALALAMAALMLAAPVFAGVDFNITGGLDVLGKFDLGEATTDSDPGFTLGLELMFEVPVVELGVGLEYGFPRGTDLDDLEVDYTHLYGIARLFVFGRFYLAGRVGYYNVSADDLVEGDIDSDVTIGAGAGLGILKNLKVELIFNNLTSGFDYETWAARAVFTF
jgi:hypothetical protein